MKRREARTYAVQVLYQLEMTDHSREEALSNVLEGEAPDPFLTKVVDGVMNHKMAIDEQIRAALTNWRLDRLSRVDRAILRIAVYEMYHMQEAPDAVVVNEAVELGKMFGNEENGKFINGVLSQILLSKQQGE